MSSESLPTSELAVVDDEVLPVELDAAPVVVVPELPPLVVRAVVVPVAPVTPVLCVSSEVETDPLIGVVVKDGGASFGAHAISQVLARHAKSGDGEADSTRRLRPTLRVSARF